MIFDTSLPNFPQKFLIGSNLFSMFFSLFFRPFFTDPLESYKVSLNTRSENAANLYHIKWEFYYVKKIVLGPLLHFSCFKFTILFTQTNIQLLNLLWIHKLNNRIRSKLSLGSFKGRGIKWTTLQTAVRVPTIFHLDVIPNSFKREENLIQLIFKKVW